MDVLGTPEFMAQNDLHGTLITLSHVSFSLKFLRAALRPEF